MRCLLGTSGKGHSANSHRDRAGTVKCSYPTLHGAGALALVDVQAAGKNKHRAVNKLSLNGETREHLGAPFLFVACVDGTEANAVKNALPRPAW